MIQVKVDLYPPLDMLAGTDELTEAVQEGTTVAEFLHRLGRSYPAIGQFEGAFLILVDGTMASGKKHLDRSVKTIKLIPAVAGG